MATVVELPTNVIAPVQKSVEGEAVFKEKGEFAAAAAGVELSEEKEDVVEAAASDLPTSSASSGSGNEEIIVAEEVILIAHVEAAKEEKGEEGVDKHEEDEALTPTPRTPVAVEEVAIATSCDEEGTFNNASTIEPTSVVAVSEGSHEEEEPVSAPNQEKVEENVSSE